MMSQSKICHLCGLKNSEAAGTCRRCGGTLLSGSEDEQRMQWQSTKRPALTACRACGQIVARNVSTCPHCGKGLRAIKAAKITMMLLALGVLGAILFYGC